MKWGKGDLGAELYVATERFPDRQQYLDSQQILNLVNQYGLGKIIEVIPLDILCEQKEVFDIIKDPKKETKLPFLICAHVCQTNAILGHSGLEDAVKELDGPTFTAYRQNFPLNQQY